MELYLDHLHLCMDFCASECASTESNGRTLGKSQADVLDNSGAGTYTRVGCATVVCGKGD